MQQEHAGAQDEYSDDDQGPGEQVKEEMQQPGEPVEDKMQQQEFRHNLKDSA